MKKITALLLILVIIMSFASCSSKFEPQKSTEEENRVVMTISFNGKSYDVKYELYRAFFLTYKTEIDGGDPSVWSSENKSEYINRINNKILDSICEMYSAFNMCRKIGIDIFSSKYDDDIEEFIERSVESIKTIILEDEKTKISDDEAYEIYLSRLKESNHNYNSHILIYRYQLAIEKIEEYYIGNFDINNPRDDDEHGKLEFERSDVEAFYNGDDSVRIIEACLKHDADNPKNRADALREKIAGMAAEGNFNGIIYAIIGESSNYPTENELKKGITLGKYQLDNMYWSEYTDAAFEIDIGAVSEVIEVHGDEGTDYYIIYKCEKSAEHFNENYYEIEEAYKYNTVAKMRYEIASGLKKSVKYTDSYSAISHAGIKM